MRSSLLNLAGSARRYWPQTPSGSATVWMHACVRAHTHSLLCTHLCTLKHTLMYTRTYTHARRHAHTRVHISMYMHSCTCTLTRLHTCKYTCTHMHVPYLYKPHQHTFRQPHALAHPHMCTHLHAFTTLKHTHSCQPAVPQFTMMRHQGRGSKGTAAHLLVLLSPLPPTDLLHGEEGSGFQPPPPHPHPGDSIKPMQSQGRVKGGQASVAGSEVTHCRPYVGCELSLGLKRLWTPPCPGLGVGGGKSPQLWHLQIEDQVVEPLLGDAVMKTH
jgi:hypothetical protein